MSGAKQNHPYHLVDPSPWPIIGASAGLVLAMGLLMFMHELKGGAIVLGIGSIKKLLL